MAHREVAGEGFRVGVAQTLEGLVGPVDRTGRCLLADDLLELLRVVARALEELAVLDDVLGRHDDDVAHGVVARSPGPPGDLVELAGGQVTHALAVELHDARQQHGADRHVDADAQGVGAADDLEQTLLGEALDHPAVLGQHAGVVHTDPRTQVLAEGFAEARGEAEVTELLDDRRLLVLAGEVGAQQRLGAVDGVLLREVHDVHRCAVGVHEVFDDLAEGLDHVAEAQRDRAVDARDLGDGAAGALLEVGAEHLCVTEGRRHEQELGLGQLEQRHLPRPAALGVGVEVELVHDHLVDTRVLSVDPARAQRDVREDLRGAADDRSRRVDRRVARHHADVLGAEDLDEGEELLAHERLEGSRVEGPLPLGHRDVVRARRHEGLARARGGAEDDVRARDQLDERLFLRGVQVQAPVLRPRREALEQLVRVRCGTAHGGRDVVEEADLVRRRGGHPDHSPRFGADRGDSSRTVPRAAPLTCTGAALDQVRRHQREVSRPAGGACR